MKLTALMIAALLFISSTGLAQDHNKTIIDEESGEEILSGILSHDDLMNGLFAPYIDEYYPLYEPDKKVIRKLKKVTDNISILIVLGTWCGDSQEQVPYFLKVMDMIKFPGEQLTIVGVDRAKESEDMEIQNYAIELVPTFIVFKEKEEIGRIIETPETTLENDLLFILE